MQSTPKCDTRNDGEEWKAIRHACKVLMFTDEELSEILRILAIVLHLGNVQYQGNEESNVIFRFYRRFSLKKEQKEVMVFRSKTQN